MQFYHYVFLLIYIVLTASGNLLIKTNKKPQAQTLFVIALWGTIISTVILCLSFIWIDPFANLNFVNFLSLIGRAGVGFLVLAVSFRAIQYLPVSLVEPISLTKLFPFLILSWLIYDDITSTVEIALVVLMFGLGALLGVTQKKSQTKKGNNKYMLGLLFVVLYILFQIPQRLLTKEMSVQNISPILVQLAICVFALITTTTTVILQKSNPLKVFASNTGDVKLVMLSVCKYTWMFFYYPLLDTMNLGVLEALLVSVSAIVLLGGRIFFKEKMTKLGYVIAIFILLCALAIALAPK